MASLSLHSLNRVRIIIAMDGRLSVPFVDFGPSAFSPAGHEPRLMRIEGKAARLRTEARQHCPRRAGVYGMIDTHGDLIYVGKAKSLRARLLSYFRPKSRGPRS